MQKKGCFEIFVNRLGLQILIYMQYPYTVRNYLKTVNCDTSICRIIQHKYMKLADRSSFAGVLIVV